VLLNISITPIFIAVPCKIIRFLERQRCVVDSLPNRLVIRVFELYALPNKVAVCVEYFGGEFTAVTLLVL